MPKFLTPPVWYDKNGNPNTMLTGVTDNAANGIPIGQEASVSGTNGIAIGQGASASGDNGIAIGQGVSASGDSGIAIGGTVGTSGTNGIAIGQEASASGKDGIAIGRSAKVNSANGIAIGGTVGLSSANGIAILGTVSSSSTNGIAIGQGANVSTQNTIQLGNNNNAYALNVGNGTGTSKIGALSFNKATPTNIGSAGLYWCTATETKTISGQNQSFSRSAFLWIESTKSTQASATNGSVTFSYDNLGGTGDWAIRASGDNVTNLKCYKVFV